MSALAGAQRFSIKTPAARFGTVKGKGGKFKVDGLSESLRRLKILPDRINRKVMRLAINKGCTPVVRAARKMAPVGDGLKPDGTERKHLKDTMTKRVKTYRNGTVVGVVGPRAKAAPHAKLVELGTDPHEIKIGKDLILKNGVRIPAGTIIKHPGAAATHFLHNAFESVKGQVQDIVETTVAVGIEVEAAKLARAK